MNQVLYRGKVWYAIDTLEGVKLSRGHDIEILTQDEYDYALMRGDVKMLEKKEKIKVIEIKEEVQVGDIILEKGDKIEVLKERSYITIDEAIIMLEKSSFKSLTILIEGAYGISVGGYSDIEVKHGMIQLISNQEYVLQITLSDLKEMCSFDASEQKLVLSSKKGTSYEFIF